MKTGTRAWASVFGWITGVGATLAGIIYFVNGLTQPARTVLVGLQEPAITLAGESTNVLSLAGATAKFHLVDIHGADRVFNHLHAASFYLVLAAVGFALVGQTHAYRNPGKRWLFVRSRFSTALGLSVIAMGVIPPLASNVASTATLSAAGSPKGIYAVGNIDLEWIFIGLLYLAAVRAFGQPDANSTSSQLQATT